jgi:hypothetical protein
LPQVQQQHQPHQHQLLCCQHWLALQSAAGAALAQPGGPAAAPPSSCKTPGAAAVHAQTRSACSEQATFSSDRRTMITVSGMPAAFSTGSLAEPASPQVQHCATWP